MKLISIERNKFPLWKNMRAALYDSLDDAYDDIEMEQIFKSDDWYCRFIIDKDNFVIGMIELSSRNIVDGCLSSPVAYLEGLYLKPEYRSQGFGKKTIAIILEWCRENGFSELATDTELSNTNAQDFYTVLGFEETYRVVEFRIDVD